MRHVSAHNWHNVLKINTIQIGGGTEFVLVDDGSTDDTYAQLKELAKQSRSIVTVIHKENGGVSSARNAGMDIAQGEWIGFLDSDDVIAPGGLQYLLDSCLSDDCDILCYDYKCLPQVPTHFSDFTNNVTYESSGQDYYLHTKAITVWHFLYKRDYLQANGLKFRPISIGEDTLFNFEAFMANGRVRCVDAVITYHIDREGSLTTSTHPAYVRKIIDSAVYMQEFYTSYIAGHDLSPRIIDTITAHRKRNVLFVFGKITATPDFTVKEIRQTAERFGKYSTLPIRGANSYEKVVNYLYYHPAVFKLYIMVNSIIRNSVRRIRR